MSNTDVTYTITYPHSVREEAASKGEDILPFFSKQDKLPIIVLFGWLGCKDKHLEKYSSIYEKQGFTTIRSIARSPLLTVKLHRLPVLANMFLDFIYQHGFENHAFIIHAFSNSGTLFYQELSLEMQKQNRTLPIKGIIFDSAPHRITFNIVYRFIQALVFGGAWYFLFISMFMALIVMIYFQIWSLVKAAIEFKKPEPVNVHLDEEPYTWPQMVIYSRNDNLSSWKDVLVDSFVQRREERGVKVTKLFFENSPHVQHLISHREIYINSVTQFIRTCLKIENSIVK